MGKKWELSDFEHGMVGAMRAGLSISETAELLGFSVSHLPFVTTTVHDKGVQNTISESKT